LTSSSPLSSLARSAIFFLLLPVSSIILLHSLPISLLSFFCSSLSLSSPFQLELNDRHLKSLDAIQRAYDAVTADSSCTPSELLLPLVPVPSGRDELSNYVKAGVTDQELFLLSEEPKIELSSSSSSTPLPQPKFSVR
jgi:hypothetical protein